MFALTTLAYPCVLALLSIGAGLLVDRFSAGFVPGALLPALGAATLIAVSQLSTYLTPLAPATPYLIAAVSLAGFLVGSARLRAFRQAPAGSLWLWAVVLTAYVVALAPVLLSGRATFSSYLALADSAVHLVGADFLIHHGQSYVHLDGRNSYGRVIVAYYKSSYPSGADTLFGASALLLRLPLIWAFQPFNAFMLAISAGPAWVIARRIGLAGGWAALAALSATIPALVYGYELIGSIKEISALPMILTLGALVTAHDRRLRGSLLGVIPFALVLAAGVSVLGVAFAVWGLAAMAVLVAVAVHDLRARIQTRSGLLLIAAGGAILTLLWAWPRWIDLPGSVRVAKNIASTSNPGNLHAPLRLIQVFGVWLGGSYKLLPSGGRLSLTYVLIALIALCSLAGAVHLVRTHSYALAAWLALLIVVWLGVTQYTTTWADAKALMLTQPAVVMLAWAGLARLRLLNRPAALTLAGVLVSGILVSDAMQYHSSNLAPTGRYEELASLDSRFGGQGPTLFTDFDEYSMYELRDMDVGGPDFVYAPAGIDQGHGQPVDLGRIPSALLLGYPLIVTRRDPGASRPPAAYRLRWQGSYYQVWQRRAHALPAVARVEASANRRIPCGSARRLARIARAQGGLLAAVRAPELVRIALVAARRPRSWGRQRKGLVMSGAGRLTARFRVPSGGRWVIWLQGQIMPTIKLGVDGRTVREIGGMLGGNSLVADTSEPIEVNLSAGAHQLSITRSGWSPAPGDGGSAVLDGILLSPASGAGQGSRLGLLPPQAFRSLCTEPLEWIEAVRRA